MSKKKKNNNARQQKRADKSRARAKASARKTRLDRQGRRTRRNVLVKNIRKWDDPILSQQCDPVEKTEAGEVVDLLKETLEATKDGVGLAAPQIGHSKRVIVWREYINASKINVMINPIIEDANPATQTMTEGCLSYPGITAQVERPTVIKVRWKDKFWMDHVETFEGRSCIIISHEIDHLEGICKVGDAWREQVAAEEQVGQVESGELLDADEVEEVEV